MTKKELVSVLRHLLQGLVDAETPTPKPPPQPPEPPAGHEAHLTPGKFGIDWCCEAHTDRLRV
jgi:hypothetical protein